MTLDKITDSTFAVVDGTTRGNMGFIIFGNRALVVDTGMNHLVTSKIRDEFLKTGTEPDMILFTHYHSDHTFGAQCFGEIPIISSVQTNQVIEDMLTKNWTRDSIINGYEKVKDERPKLWEAVQTLEIRKPISTFDANVELGENKEVSVIHLGGHTTGSSIAFLKSERVVFIGDLIFNKSFPYAGDPTCEPDAWIAALDRVIQIKPEIVIPGHG
ncbi:MAG: MBL fold metallo-hydrolase, partial [Candidatus Lokiarchaeota archaeon]|nr:MBL fold metallo-hydrolase [Candidatus Lokiarchaeota archaeon]